MDANHSIATSFTCVSLFKLTESLLHSDSIGAIRGVEKGEACVCVGGGD